MRVLRVVLSPASGGCFADSIKSIDAKMHNAELSLERQGVLVKRGGKHGNAIIPYVNIAWISVEEDPQPLTKAEREAYLAKGKA